MPKPNRSTLKPQQLVELRTALETKRDQLLAQREDRIERVREPREDLVGDEMDEADSVSHTEGLVHQAGREEQLLLQIDHALQRMNQGMYGVDESTGEPISLARLRAVPWATENAGTVEMRERQR
jgi:DnaK suppressor protein